MFSLSPSLIWRLTATATVLGLALIWLLSGVLPKDDAGIQPSIAELNKAVEEQAKQHPPITVRARRSFAQEKPRTLTLHGKTEVKRITVIKSETVGRVVQRNVEDGATVKRGDPLCTLEVNDREASVAAAQDAVLLATFEHDGALQLRENDYQMESAVVAAKAQLSASQHALILAKQALDNTVVRAPVSGFVERVHATVGDYLVPGTPCATVLELDPIYAVVHVAEQYITKITLGTKATASLATGQMISGTVSFVGKQAKDASRTFRVEIVVPNLRYEIRAGITAEVDLPLKTYSAHQISAALLVLGDAGVLGIHSVNDSRVEFHEIAIIAEDRDGVWVAGLPPEIAIVISGQDLVAAGQIVHVQWVSS